jgi:hypothetical protein
MTNTCFSASSDGMLVAGIFSALVRNSVFICSKAATLASNPRLSATSDVILALPACIFDFEVALCLAIISFDCWRFSSMDAICGMMTLDYVNKVVPLNKPLPHAHQ